MWTSTHVDTNLIQKNRDLLSQNEIITEIDHTSEGRHALTYGYFFIYGHGTFFFLFLMVACMRTSSSDNYVFFFRDL